jgi:predicted neutral ceramidase superfamily lipid hydrolase
LFKVSHKYFIAFLYTAAAASTAAVYNQYEASYLLTFDILQSYSADDITRKNKEESSQKILKTHKKKASLHYGYVCTMLVTRSRWRIKTINIYKNYKCNRK